MKALPNKSESINGQPYEYDFERITKTKEDLKRLIGKPAFRHWQYKLKQGETLPRGKFFKGKKPKGGRRPLIILDEAWMFLSQGAKEQAQP